MQEFWDKGLLMLCCLAMALLHSADPFLVVPLIVAILASAAASLWDRPLSRGGGILLLCALGLFNPTFLIFLPLCLYDAWLTNQAWLDLAALAPLVLHFEALQFPLTAGLILLAAASLLLKSKTLRISHLRESLTQVRDSAAELALRLEKTNRELQKGQDEQVHTAQLAERNRIAREIHDNVGHLLSSAMLQLGALLSLPRAQEFRENLTTLKATLAQGMDNIRQSVHGLYDESVDLQEELSLLVRSFTFCRATLDYDVETSPNRQVKYAFLAVVKEALSNIARHSQATSVLVTVREHPAVYQLDIRDNGENARYDPDRTTGIGISNMTRRVTDLNGRIHISTDKGFHIFISVPKEEPK